MKGPGDCEYCVHSRVIRTKRSIFYLCERSFTDPRYPKYPPLPVRNCPGYEERDPAAPDRQTEPE